MRQSVLLYTSTRETAVFLEPDYDVIERVVRFRQFEAGRLAPSTLYTVEIITSNDSSGFRAFDGAPLGEGPIPLTFNFFTGTADEVKPDEPAVPDCREVLNIFRGARAGCASCHLTATGGAAGCPPNSAPDPSYPDECVGVPRQGLDLSSLSGLERTALAQVAHQTEVGARAGEPLQNPGRVGVQMPVIDPGRPENSYMIYKLLRNESNFIQGSAPGSSDKRVALPGGSLFAPEAERQRLREWFVRLDPMPAQGFSLDLAEFRALQLWIRAGADTSACR